MSTVRPVLPALALVALVALAGTAEAGSITIKIGKFSQGTGIGQGGEFKVTSYDGPLAHAYAGITAYDAGSLFNSFCLERNEQLAGTTNYKLNTATVSGGVAGGNPDPLSEQAAKLFYAWWTNAWLGAGATVAYDYSNSTHRTVDAEDMQLALWFLENEITQKELTKFDNGKAQKFVNFANGVTWSQLGQSKWTGIGDVRVLNDYDRNGANRQDTLVVVPLPPAAAPGLAALGLVGLVGRLRRRRSG